MLILTERKRVDCCSCSLSLSQLTDPLLFSHPASHRQPPRYRSSFSSMISVWRARRRRQCSSANLLRSTSNKRQTRRRLPLLCPASLPAWWYLYQQLAGELGGCWLLCRGGAGALGAAFVRHYDYLITTDWMNEWTMTMRCTLAAQCSVLLIRRDCE